MGACGSSDDDKEGPANILLCGTGAVGKSTILKNLMNICGHKETANDEDLNRYEMKRMTISTMLATMKVIIEEKLLPDHLMERAGNIATMSEEAAKFYDTFDQDDHESKQRRMSLRVDFNDTRKIFEAAKDLWKEHDMSSAFESARSLMEARAPFLQDSTIHFMTPDYFDKLSCETLELSTQDMLLLRRATRGASEYEFKFDGRVAIGDDGTPEDRCLYKVDDPAVADLPPATMIDVGGHHSERAAWQAYFNEDLKCLIFVMALDDYHKKLPKATKGLVTKLDDSLKVFESLVKHPKLIDVPFVVCMNKSDELKWKCKSKRKTFKMERYYKACVQTGKRQKPDELMSFMRKMYLEIVREHGLTNKDGNRKTIETYESVAINPQLTEAVLSKVIGAIFNAGMSRAF